MRWELGVIFKMAPLGNPFWGGGCCYYFRHKNALAPFSWRGKRYEANLFSAPSQNSVGRCFLYSKKTRESGWSDVFFISGNARAEPGTFS